MTYREFCDEIAPMVVETKELCKDMTLEEFEDYKNQVRQDIAGGDKIGLLFVEEILAIINPHKKVA